MCFPPALTQHIIPTLHSDDPVKNKFCKREALPVFLVLILMYPLLLVLALLRIIAHPLRLVCRPARTQGKTILVTGAKMTKAYYICRSLSLRGYRVIAVECGVGFCTSSWSRHVDRFITVPDPSKDGLSAYLCALKQIMQDEDVDLVVPGVGIAEACPLARLYDEVPEKVFFCSSVMVDTLNDKNEFFKLARKYNTTDVHIPHTIRINDKTELLRVLSELEATEHPAAEFFIKRLADSRNRERDTRRGTVAQLRNFELLPGEPYVLQPFIDGKEYTASFSVFKGVVTGLCVSNGEAVNMTYYSCPQHIQSIRAWLEPFMAGINYNGFGSIDLIHRELDNKLFVLEFNPRLHSCCVLFNDAPVWSPDTSAFFQPPSNNLPCYWFTNELLKTVMGHQSVRLLLHRVLMERSVLNLKDDPWVELSNFIHFTRMVYDTYAEKGIVDIIVLDNCIMKAITSE